MSKPVAWRVGELVFSELNSAEHQADIVNEPITPLYTHPMRELTDEEIESAYWSLVGKQHEGKIASYLYNFARDILKKASEK